MVELRFEEETKLCFFGDAGTGNDNQKAVAKLLLEEKCQAYFYLGDLIYPSGIESKDDPELKKRFWDVYEPLLKNNHMFLMMGNHDYKGNMDTWIDVAKENKNLHYPSHYYLVKINNMCLPVMNTTSGKFSQLIWLSKLKLEDCEIVALTGHHPLKSSGKHKSPYFPLNIFLKYAVSKAQVYIAGHDHHLSYEGIVNGVHQFVSGAAGQLRTLDQELPVWGKSQLGYLTMVSQEDSYNFQFWGLNDQGDKDLLYSKKIEPSSLASE